MRIGFFSPLPPAQTGVADYSASLLSWLRQLGTVEIAPEICDVALYHVGNNALHREIYQRALAEPGIVVLHDAVLQHLLLGMLDGDAYVDEFVYNYGDSARDLGRQLWEQRARSGADARYFAYPLLKRLALASRAIIVHNPEAAESVRRHAPTACILEIPHLFEARHLPSCDETIALRRSLGVEDGTLLIGAFGHQRETKRLGVLLRAFQRVSQANAAAGAKLLVSGDFVSKTFESAIAPLLQQPGILRTGYLSEAGLWRHAAATDVCVNLRFPSAAETSGIAVRMMGIGKAVIFTDGAAVSRIPDNACLLVPVGVEEEEMLAGYLDWLAANRTAAAEIGQRAAAHIREHHAPEKIARQYWDALKKY
jgi:glycosyltransferase involved in cell wall biosynthesis